ncbi:MAG: hypothetical protein ABFS17_06235 [Chloroflexota bacterium]
MKRSLILLFVLVLLAMTFTTAFAQTEAEVLACPDGEISGVIVAYDEETGIVTLNVDGELCTVNLTNDYDHPITELLGAYFSELNTEDIGAALEELQVCAVLDGEEYVVTAPDEFGECAEGELVTVTGEGDEGGFEAQTESGDVIVFEPESEEAAAGYADALASLQADWDIEDGSIGDVGEDIGQYHDDGIGFGVLVKVYAIYEQAQLVCNEVVVEELADEGEVVEEAEEDAAEEDTEEIDPCDVTVEGLLEELEGMGLGQLFKIYGKPAIMGVGHVRNIGEGDGSSGDGSTGICNARSNGGNANATGQPDIVCDGVDSTKDKSDDD